MATIKGEDIGNKVCDVFGLDHNKISGIDIHLHKDETAQIHFFMYPDKDQLCKVIDILNKYELKEIKKSVTMSKQPPKQPPPEVQINTGTKK